MPSLKSMPCVFGCSTVTDLGGETFVESVHLFLPDFVAGAVLVKVTVFPFQFGALFLHHDAEPFKFLTSLFGEGGALFRFDACSTVGAATEIGRDGGDGRGDDRADSGEDRNEEPIHIATPGSVLAPQCCGEIESGMDRDAVQACYDRWGRLGQAESRWLLGENAELRKELYAQWERNHSENCQFPRKHAEGDECYWPIPEVIADLAPQRTS
jgi:hypothetical protein